MTDDNQSCHAAPTPCPVATAGQNTDVFWQSADLSQLTIDQWEALCDGCGKCCLHKLEDEEEGTIFYTRVACQFLDLATGRCIHYADRFRWVSDCVTLTPETIGRLKWLPRTCAYRLRAAGHPLPVWHPLCTGDPNSTRRAGMTVCGWAISERRVRQLEDYLIEIPI